MRFRSSAVLTFFLLQAVPAPGSGGSPDSLKQFAESMFDVVSSDSRSCPSMPDEIEETYCAGAKLGVAKLKSKWDQGVSRLGTDIEVEPVTDWESGRGLHWRYYTLDRRPIVVQFNAKSKSLEIIGSTLPRCEDPLDEGSIEILGGDEDATPPEKSYGPAFWWPFRAHAAGQAGRLRLIGVISKEGVVAELCVDVLEPPIVDLELAAAKALLEFKFKPASGNGQPLEARVPFEFDLDPDDAEVIKRGY